MRAVVQRVKRSSVSVAGVTIGEIKEGFNVLLGVSTEDTEKDLKYIEDKIAGLRLFDDEDGVMNVSLEDKKGEILLISQFTLYGDARKGRRPSYIHAQKGEQAVLFYNKMVENLRARGFKVETGEFGAEMEVTIVNDGPVTILLDSSKQF
ncbi:MAG: D-tyrosyl-tRNA(Tyr) deacylase [Clostridium sp.]|jgi:D-tyrosyl-tRNA(Tyr) deacylase|nr:D-tyrosyl-tRNA(Tyr) deacylase [Clostridium sp.]